MLEYPPIPYPYFLANLEVNKAELLTGGGYNPTDSSNKNIAAMITTSTSTNTMGTSTFLPKLIENNAAISMGGGGNMINRRWCYNY